MKAVIKPAYVKDRIKLGEALPISTPYRLTISPIQLCNFKCFYCTHSLDREEVKKTGFKFSTMKYEEFVELADQFREFPEKIKLIVFSGMGEPLLNKDFPKMVKYLKDNDLAERVEVYTNASLLSEEITHKLVDAGLDSLKISIQGLNSDKYKEVCGFDLDYDKFMKNIKYFYENRKQCKMYIKIIDAMLKEGEDKQFYEMFGNMCDEIFIEHLSDCQPLTGNCEGKVDAGFTMYNDVAKYSKVCPLLFYTLYVDVECNIYPCVTLGLPTRFAIDNIKNRSIAEIWNSEEIRKLRIEHLKGNKGSQDVCGTCGNMTAMYHEEDDLDEYSETLLQKYSK
ncbi:radical SAM/SPASM domain-containing protein [Paraclostridium bifermentans]|uniref:radical SAM/SPASM domain-containing protein n=1 Tax=Paraclostridium bifermentans TaxID=1490 RepID=UPI00359C7658